MTGKERDKIRKWKGAPKLEYLGKPEISLANDQKILQKIFRSEIMAYFEKKGILTGKKDWSVEFFFDAQTNKVSSFLKLTFETSQKKYQMDIGKNLLTKWQTNDKTLFQTMKKDKETELFFIRNGIAIGTANGIRFKDVLAELEDFCDLERQARLLSPKDTEENWEFSTGIEEEEEWEEVM